MFENPRTKNPRAREHIYPLALNATLRNAVVQMAAKYKIDTFPAAILMILESGYQEGFVTEEEYVLLKGRYTRTSKEAEAQKKGEDSHKPVLTIEKEKRLKHIDYSTLSNQEVQELYFKAVQKDDSTLSVMLHAEAKKRNIALKGSRGR